MMSESLYCKGQKVLSKEGKKHWNEIRWKITSRQRALELATFILDNRLNKEWQTLNEKEKGKGE